jgi:adenosylcobyric acid synthase
MPTPAIMILGTGSHVGKSLITAALCRIFRQHGIRVAPFKSQNMSLNSAVTPEGLEIGRAQALQAEAAGIPASVHMNPILLKPSGNMTSQVVVRGKIWGQLSAADYHLRRVHDLLPLVRASYEILARQHELILLEGAGSPAEINLKQHDIVNMRMAEMADAACLLVGDIDRGGVFASLLGTLELLEHDERARIRGTVINKFRGDVNLLTPGLTMLEARTATPCLGVVPHYPNLTLDEEDSLGLPEITSIPFAASGETSRRLRIAVLALPSLSNFTDFDSLRAEPSVDLRLVRTAAALAHADLVILPGSKQTAADLTWLRLQHLDAPIRQIPLLVGICGGMQMLGRCIDDPEAIESGGTIDGLNLLPIDTTMRPAKTTVLTRATLTPTHLFDQAIPHTQVSGYEIHIGETTYLPGAQPFATSPLAQPDGCIGPSTRVFGSYLHGLFDDDRFRETFLTAARAFYRLSPAPSFNRWQHQREQALDAFAAHVEQSLDMTAIFRYAGLTYKARA